MVFVSFVLVEWGVENVVLICSTSQDTREI